MTPEPSRSRTDSSTRSIYLGVLIGVVLLWVDTFITLLVKTL